jgi:hypothetical protein
VACLIVAAAQRSALDVAVPERGAAAGGEDPAAARCKPRGAPLLAQHRREAGRAARRGPPTASSAALAARARRGAPVKAARGRGSRRPRSRRRPGRARAARRSAAPNRAPSRARGGSAAGRRPTAARSRRGPAPAGASGSDAGAHRPPACSPDRRRSSRCGTRTARRCAGSRAPRRWSSPSSPWPHVGEQLRDILDVDGPHQTKAERRQQVPLEVVAVRFQRALAPLASRDLRLEARQPPGRHRRKTKAGATRTGRRPARPGRRARGAPSRDRPQRSESAACPQA